MPWGEPEPDDPSMLVGNVVECTRAELQEMAATFASEMAQLGYDAEFICGLFRSPAYAGPGLAWRTLGEAEVVRLVDEAVRFWSRCRVVVTDRRSPPTGDLLTIGATNGTAERRD